jgi:hypothetical protein
MASVARIGVLSLVALCLSTRESAAQLPPLVELTAQYVPESEVPGAGGLHAQVSSYDAAFNVPLVLGKRTFLIPGGQYHAESVSFSQTPEGFKPLRALHSIDVPVLLAHQLSDEWSLAFRVWPGIAGDFHGFDSSMLRVGALAMGSWTPSEKLTLGGGALASYGFGELLPLPVVYVDWKPEPWFRAEASLPFFASALFRIGDRFEVGALGDVNGNEYAIQDSAIRDSYPCAASETDDPATPVDETQKDSSNCTDHLAYSSVTAGGVARVRVVSTVWVTTFLARTLFRRSEFKNPDGETIAGGRADLPNEIVFRAGLVFRIPMPGEPGS